jgi:hypothetical protein
VSIAEGALLDESFSDARARSASEFFGLDSKACDLARVRHLQTVRI